MKEQLISLETAKLAKEKGFDIQTLHFWTTDKKPYLNKGLEYMSDCYCKSNWNNGQGSYPTSADEVNCSAPTQSLLQKWLREVHKIHIEVKTYSCSMPEEFTYSVSILLKSYGSWIEIDSYLNYEEALEKGLQEALKLI